MIYSPKIINIVRPQPIIGKTVLDKKRHRYEQPDYEIVVVRKGKNGWFLSRKIIFSRTDLQVHRQLIYNDEGVLVTDVRYGEYKEYDSIPFPSQIEISRPQEEYDITLNIVKMDINKPLTDEQFALQQPPGAEVVRLGGQPAIEPVSESHSSGVVPK